MKSKPIRYLRSMSMILIGIGAIAIVFSSNYPQDVWTNIPSDLGLAGAAAFFCALGFTCSAVFWVAGFRWLLSTTRTLQLHDDGCTIRQLGKEKSEHPVSAIEALIVVPDVEGAAIWSLKFDDGTSFAVDTSWTNFRAGLQWACRAVGDRVVSQSIEEFEPIEQIPLWIKRLSR